MKELIFPSCKFTPLFKKLDVYSFLYLLLSTSISKKFDMSVRSGKELSQTAIIDSWKMAIAKWTFCLLSLGCSTLNVWFEALRNLASRMLSLLYILCMSDYGYISILGRNMNIWYFKCNTNLYLLNKLFRIFLNIWTKSKNKNIILENWE